MPSPTECATSADCVELKIQLRAHIRARRQRIPQPVRQVWDTQLAQAAAALVDSRMTVACYIPAGFEPGAAAVDGFVETMAQTGARIIVPKVEQGRVLSWWEWDPNDCVEGKFGLIEPSGLGAQVELSEADLVFVPALAVDIQGFRLGQGGGFYDTALEGAQVPTVALVHPGEVIARVPHEPWDLKARTILTACGFIFLN